MQNKSMCRTNRLKNLNKIYALIRLAELLSSQTQTNSPYTCKAPSQTKLPSNSSKEHLGKNSQRLVIIMIYMKCKVKIYIKFQSLDNPC